MAKYGGYYRNMSSQDMLAGILEIIVDRVTNKSSSFDPHEIEDVHVGILTQIGEQGGNLARIAQLMAKNIPDIVAGATVNRYCNAGLQAVNTCARVKEDETVVIITDQATYDLAHLLSSEVIKIPGTHVSTFVMEDYGERSEDGNRPLAFPEEIGKRLATAQVSFYAARSLPGEGKTLIHTVHPNGRYIKIVVQQKKPRVIITASD